MFPVTGVDGLHHGLQPDQGLRLPLVADFVLNTGQKTIIELMAERAIAPRVD